MALDPVHDEIIAPNPFGQAILFFRGGARGDEPPIRIIQGPKTLLGYTDNAVVDPIHSEVFTAQFRTDAVLVFRSDVGGNVEPIRIIHGPKTKLDRPERLSVDPVNNLLAVTTVPGVLIFNRTDNGDVAPRWTIAGPKTGIGGEGNSLQTPLLSPQGKKILIAGGAGGGEGGGTGRGSSSRQARQIRIIGVWKYGDNGDIAPWAVLHQGTPGMALNPDAEELITISQGKILFYHMPELFRITE